MKLRVKTRQELLSSGWTEKLDYYYCSGENSIVPAMIPFLGKTIEVEENSLQYTVKYFCKELPIVHWSPGMFGPERVSKKRNLPDWF